MRRQPQPIGPSADGARIIVALVTLTILSAAMMIGALVAWGAL